MISKRARREWLLNYLETGQQKYVDVLNADFVNDYISATGASATAQPFGAPTCRQLGRDLSDLHQRLYLARGRASLNGHESGFPNWVYVYSLRVEVIL